MGGLTRAVRSELGEHQDVAQQHKAVPGSRSDRSKLCGMLNGGRRSAGLGVPMTVEEEEEEAVVVV